MTLPAVAILGVGAMGGAILHGLVASGIEVQGGIRISDQWSERVAELSRADGVTGFDGAADPRANHRAAEGAGVVIVAVKPHQIRDLLTDIGDALAEDATVISIAAGVPTEVLEAHLPASVAVVRVMPNSPARVRAGVTGIAAGARAGERDLERARELFATIGEVLVVDEDRIDALTSISGSGPAYVFHFIEKFVEAARARGFSDADAKLLVEGTVRGAVDLLTATGEDPAVLRRQVTSPGGTTQAALEVLDAADLGTILDAATRAAVVRAAELAAG
ncbi:pyrroline-5-carboxylate reductase [Microbacterium sp. No. 7]|uniref:pyrroline-5-carboxylate reductase n=1 Tax=Microbacterium sp. No. 7 TaxID=1714373 RepID=UPI0006D29CA1|nr:pyrroline-5-carboxylate reductase [Microbacterium sp. No. 7]ALJ18806.1 pyrroline-5-carboxylate reductase [Microbacterium sp. No. 7]